MKGAILLLLLADACAAQIAIYTVDAVGNESTAKPLIDIPQTYTGDYSDTRFRLRNTGAAAVTLSALRISGVGFSLIGAPPLPHQIAVGSNVDFRVRFQPTGFGSFSATLLVNEQSILVRGSAPQGATLAGQSNGQWQNLSAASSWLLGRVEFGQQIAGHFLLRNDSTATVVVKDVTVFGEAIMGPLGLNLPVTLTPGAAVPFEINFSPIQSGLFHGSLTLDGRLFQLEAIGTDPPPPEAIISADSTLSSGAQGKLSIRFVQPVRASIAAKVTLSFQPLSAASGDDPAAIFLATGSRNVQVPVQVGASAAPDTLFQTGTTAGTITLTVQVGIQVLQTMVTIAPAPVAVDRVTPSRTSTGVHVEITGFDNTRSASLLAFRFYDRSGNMLGTQPIRTDAAAAFQQYFQQSTVGGMFLLRADFPVAGDATIIGAVDVEVTNSAGVQKPARAQF